jgi:hypothetical protein
MEDLSTSSDLSSCVNYDPHPQLHVPGEEGGSGHGHVRMNKRPLELSVEERARR